MTLRADTALLLCFAAEQREHTLLQAGDGVRHQGEVCIQSGGVVRLGNILVFFHQLLGEFEATQAQVFRQHQGNALVPTDGQACDLFTGVQVSLYFFTQQINAAAAHHAAFLARLAQLTLGAQFEIRDTLATDIQSRLDALAVDLATRVATHDPAHPDAGPETSVFDFGGQDVSSIVGAGAALLLGVNSAISPLSGGDASLLRDGLTGGDPGDGTRLDQIVKSLTSTEGASGKTVFKMVEEIASSIGTNRIWAEDTQTRDAARLDQARKTEAQVGVDTDAELQHLLEVEKAYAANARVIETINALFDDLLRI